MIENYPLHWPDNQTRTPAIHRVWGSFQTSQNEAQNGVMKEISLLGGTDIILSTNIRLRRDGMPYTSDREPDDGGVAVYFTLKGKQMCFACDSYYKVKANMQAIRLTIGALRGIERWGASSMLDKAFMGFVQIEAPKTAWYEVLGVKQTDSLDDIRIAYKRLAANNHPDRSGNAETMAKINEAWAKAQELK